MTTRAVVCTGLDEPWKTEEVEIDPPAPGRSGSRWSTPGCATPTNTCARGDICAAPEVLEAIGVPSMFPVVGGHEGSGVVTEVGTT